MKCTDVRSRMPSFVAWELPPAQARAVGRHISRCAECIHIYHDVVAMAEAWQDDREIPGLDLVTPVLERLRTGGAPAEVVRPWTLPGRVVFVHYAVAASLAVILFQTGVFQHVGSLAQHGAALSGQVTRLAQLFSRF